MKKIEAFKIFAACANAMSQGVLISRVSRTDKEFHFQNWFEDRLREAGVLFDRSGRNSYPDFTLVKIALERIEYMSAGAHKYQTHDFSMGI